MMPKAGPKIKPFSLREKNSISFFWSSFVFIRNEYGYLQFPNTISVDVSENTNQTYSEPCQISQIELFAKIDKRSF